MRSLLDHFAVLHHDNLVGITDGGKSVSDDDDRLLASFDQLIKCLLHLMLGLGVQSTGRLVEQEHPRLANEGSRDRNSLLLPSTQADASLTHNRGITIGEELLILDKGVDIGLLATLIDSRLDLLFGEVTEVNTVHDVCFDAAREENRLLRHDSNLFLMVPSVVQRFDVVSVVADRALGRVVEPLNQRNDRGFTATTGANDRHDLVCLHVDAHALQHLNVSLGGVGELDVIDFDVSPAFPGAQNVLTIFTFLGLLLDSTVGVDVRRRDDEGGDFLTSAEHLGDIGDVAGHLSVVIRHCLHVEQVSQDLSNAQGCRLPGLSFGVLEQEADVEHDASHGPRVKHRVRELEAAVVVRLCLPQIVDVEALLVVPLDRALLISESFHRANVADGLISDT